MADKGALKTVTVAWPTGEVMAFYCRVETQRITTTKVPTVGSLLQDAPTYVDRAAMEAPPGVQSGPFTTARYNAFEFVALVDDPEPGWQRLYYAAPLNVEYVLSGPFLLNSGNNIQLNSGNLLFINGSGFSTGSGQETYNYEVFNHGEYRWPRLVQTWLVKRANFGPTLDMAPPPNFNSTFSWTRIGSRELRTPGFGADFKVMDSLYVIYEITFEDQRHPLYGSEFDTMTGTSNQTTITVVPNGTQGQDMSGDGTYAEIEPLNTLWAIKTVRKATSLHTRTWPIVMNYSWPAVLNGIVGKILAVNVFPGVKTLVNYDWYRGAYDGPCNGTVTESWSASIPQVLVSAQMLPTPMRYDGLTFELNAPSCLHQAFVNWEFVNGSSYVENFQNFFTIPATNYTSWPESLVVSGTTENYKGGFLTRLTKVFPPS